MIDEDLYQQATDELNSDKRRPHIWARACALASDDHDEARYLYTNLRVEELIAEREASGQRPVSGDSNSGDDQYDSSLALEPLDGDEDIPESISAPSGIDQTRRSDEELTLNSAELENDEHIETFERKSFEEKFERNEETDSRDEKDDIAFSDEYLDETINLTSELDGTAVFELDKSDATEFDSLHLSEDDTGPTAGLSLDRTATPSDDEEIDELEALLGGIYQGSAPPPPTDPLADDDSGAAMTLDYSDVTSHETEHDNRFDDRLDDSLDDNVEWTEDDLPSDDDNNDLQEYSPHYSSADSSFDDTGRLAQELARQADELPGQRSDIVAISSRRDDDDSSEFSDDERELLSGDTFDEEAERDIAESLRRKFASDSVHTLDDDGIESAPHHDLGDDLQVPAYDVGKSSTSELPAAAAMATAAGAAAAAIAATARTNAIELPVDLSEHQPGRRYSVFRRGNQAQAVKNGVSWPALFLTLPYLIYRHLFGTALVYSALWLIVVAGLLVSGLAWLDSGDAANQVVKFSTIGFAVLALIGLLYLPFRYSNQWREEKLEQRGFELVAWVRASSPGKAISAARRAATLD